MAPLAGGGSASPEPHGRDDLKSLHASSAGARLLSLGLRAAVMAAALAVFLLFAAAAAVLLLHLLVAARAFRHYRHRLPPPAPPRLGLSPSDLRLLPCFAFSESSATSPQLCAVCLEAAHPGERWRALPACSHAFHAACVDQWLARFPACPICRAAVVVSVS